MTNQSDLQASVRALTGTALDYNGDFMALFDGAGIAKTDFNGRLLAWINLTLGTTYTEINGAKQAYAAALGFFNWNSLNTIDPNPGSIVELLFVGPGTPAIPFYKVNGVVYADPSLIPGWSFTRASTKTAQTSSGLVVSFASGVPAITDLGFLVEEARTQTILNSVFANISAGAPAGWSKNAGGGTPIASLYGADSAAMVFTASATQAFIDQSQSVSATTTYTASVLVEANPGGITIKDLLNVVSLPVGATISFPQGATTVAAAGVYIQATITVAGTPGTVDLRTGAGCNAVVTGSATLSRPQFEVGTFRSSYIVNPSTSSAATRAADVAFLAVVPSGPSYTLIEKALYPATWVANAVFAEGATAVSGTLKGATISTSSISGFLRLLQRSGMARGDTDGSNPSIGASAQFTAAMSTDGTTTAFSVNGATATSGATPAQADWSGGISIGSRTGSSNWADTYIKSLTLSNAAASQAVLNGRTQ